MVRLLIVFVAFFFGMQTYAADCGRFAVVKQPVKWKKQGKKKYKKATKNKTICQGDAVKTGPNGRVKIVMDDKNEINVSPNTELIIESYRDGKKAVLNVLNGKVRSDVNNKYQNSESSHFRVKTKSAVAGVRGTQFLTSYNAKTNQARVVTFEGKVEVGQMNGRSFVGKVTVNPGQYTSSSQNQDPHPPKAVPPAELAQIDRESKVDAGKAPASTGSQGNTNNSNNNEDPNEEPKANDPTQEPKADEPKQEEPSQEPKQDGQADGSANGNDNAQNDGDQRGGNQAGNRGRRVRGGARAPASVGGDGPSIGDVGPDSNPTDIPAAAPEPGLGPGPLPDLPDAPTVGPPVLPTLPPLDQICPTCNDAIINQKVRVIIRPVLEN